MLPTRDQAERWEAVAHGKVSLLRVLAGVIANGEPASSGYLRKKCGLSAEEWHGSGELIASLICFGVEKGFLTWHAETMTAYEERRDGE